MERMSEDVTILSPEEVRVILKLIDAAVDLDYHLSKKENGILKKLTERLRSEVLD